MSHVLRADDAPKPLVWTCGACGVVETGAGPPSAWAACSGRTWQAWACSIDCTRRLMGPGAVEDWRGCT